VPESIATPSSALEGIDRPGHFGAIRQEGPGVVLGEVCPRSIVQLESNDLSQTLRSALGLNCAPAVGGSAMAPHLAVLWAGPSRVLGVSGQLSAKQLEYRVVESTADRSLAFIDLSHGRTVFQVSGRDAKSLLAKGCFLDLDRLEVGGSAITRLGHFTVHLHRANGAFELYVMRSFAHSLWHWLCDAAEEFGYEVVPRRCWEMAFLP